MKHVHELISLPYTDWACMGKDMFFSELTTSGRLEFSFPFMARIPFVTYFDLPVFKGYWQHVAVLTWDWLNAHQALPLVLWVSISYLQDLIYPVPRKTAWLASCEKCINNKIEFLLPQTPAFDCPEGDCFVPWVASKVTPNRRDAQCIFQQ